MRKGYAIAVAVLMTACSNHEVLIPGTQKSKETPIEFNVQKQNITKATNLEDVNHYNFGVWAWKVQGKNSLADQEIMNHYLVGWSNGTDKGYDKTGATTYATTTDSNSDHISPWFYEGLGTAEYTYTGEAGFYTSSATDYMSKNEHQYLRYWDLAYTKTNFYCYAPYNKNVTFEKKSDNSVMTFPATAIRDGYDLPLNSAYSDYSRTLGEYMYAGVQATNADLHDVTVPFKHMGAQLYIRFYEDIPGYKVELIDLADDMATEPTTDIMKGIQATPAIKTAGTPDTYAAGTYYTTQGATVSFAEATAQATYTPSWTGSTTATNTTPLMFQIPQATVTGVPSTPAANVSDYEGLNSTTHKIIAEKVTTGDQTYSYSPTVYYPVAQPTDSKTGFTFHVSYRIIAEDNKEVITVHNATVHVPYSGKATGTDTNLSGEDPNKTGLITVWQPNVKYTYTFKITKNSTGTTNPDTEIDPTNPTPSTTKSLYPIVFDAATIEDFTLNYSEYTVSEDTNY